MQTNRTGAQHSAATIELDLNRFEGKNADEVAAELIEKYGARVADEDYYNPGDNPGEYVLYRALKIDNEPFLTIYFLNTTREIGCVEWR